MVANDDIDLAIRPGEIHVLLGENGAGKSTLIGMLAGMQQPDEGEIRVDGDRPGSRSPRERSDLGIGTVFQHVMLVPTPDGHRKTSCWAAPGGSAPDRRRRPARVARDLRHARRRDRARCPVGRLSLGEQQQVEIMRALWRGEKVLILDEPTSMLTPQGVDDLGEVMRRLREKGVAIIFITHKLGRRTRSATASRCCGWAGWSARSRPSGCER